MRLLITGSAGGLATAVLPLLKQPGRTLRLLDIAPQEASDGAEIVQASVTDLAAMVTASQAVDAVIHLGGLSTEAPWPEILSVNVDGTHNVLEAARRTSVRRVVLASSNHAVGFAPNDGRVLPDYAFPRPDTFYGVGKVAMEALGSLYHDRYGLDVICLRIGSCVERPVNRRMLATWLSPGDCARLFEAALMCRRRGFAWSGEHQLIPAVGSTSTKHAGSGTNHRTMPKSSPRHSWETTINGIATWAVRSVHLRWTRTRPAEPSARCSQPSVLPARTACRPPAVDDQRGTCHVRRGVRDEKCHRLCYICGSTHAPESCLPSSQLDFGWRYGVPRLGENRARQHRVRAQQCPVFDSELTDEPDQPSFGGGISGLSGDPDQCMHRRNSNDAGRSTGAVQRRGQFVPKNAERPVDGTEIDENLPIPTVVCLLVGRPEFNNKSIVDQGIWHFAEAMEEIPNALPSGGVCDVKSE